MVDYTTPSIAIEIGVIVGIKLIILKLDSAVGHDV